MHTWYKLFTYLFYPFSSIYLFFRILSKKEHPKRYREKISKIEVKRDEGFLIWFHVASVGEAMSILPLIENQPGFVKFHLYSNEKDNIIIVNSFWNTKENI